MNSGLSTAAIEEALAASALFGVLDPAARAALAAVCTHRHYERGEYLTHQGEAGDRLIVLVGGRVKVVLVSMDGDEMVLAALTHGESFGELAILDGAPRSASVVALEPTDVLSIGRRDLLPLMSAHPAVLTAVLSGLGAVVRRLTDTTSDLVFLDLGGRLAKALLRMAGPGPGGRGGHVDLTQSELAATVGASRQATNRALQLMAAQRWIELRGRAVVLRDEVALRRRAGLPDLS
jgi:CRP-like cAMP-binding protein